MHIASKSRRVLSLLLTVALVLTTCMVVPLSRSGSIVHPSLAWALSDEEYADLKSVTYKESGGEKEYTFEFKDSSTHPKKTGVKESDQDYKDYKDKGGEPAAKKEESSSTSTSQNQNKNSAQSNVEDLSFYKVASTASTYFQQTLRNNAMIEPNIEVAQAGDVLAYVDPDYAYTGFLTENASKSSLSISYDALSHIETQDNNNTPNNILGYMHYGNLLSDMGFDKTNAKSNDALRVVAGNAMKAVWFVSAAVDNVFDFMVRVLRLLNPFNYLINDQAVKDVLYSNKSTTVNTGEFDGKSSSQTVEEDSRANTQLNDKHWTDELTQQVGNLYSTVTSLSWTVMIPLFVALFLGSLFLGLALRRNSSAWSKVKKLAVRILFVVLGVPLLAGTYTIGLNGMADASAGSSTNSNAVVLQSFVDFEGWAASSRLNPYSINGEKWTTSVDNMDSGNIRATGATGETLSHLRQYALLINKNSLKLEGQYDASDWIGLDGSGGSGTAVWDGKNDSNLGNKWSGTGSVTDVMNLHDSEIVNSLLDRYIAGNKYESAHFASYAKSTKLGTLGAAEDATASTNNDENLVTKFTLNATDLKNYKPSKSWMQNTSNYSPVDLEKEGDDTGIYWFNDGGLLTDNQWNSGTFSFWVQPGKDKGLSTMSMYNYLNSEFDDAGVTLYSPEKASSSYTKPSHYSVNAIGNGVYGILIFLNSFVLLLAFSVIGLGYAIALIISNIKHGVGAIVSIPFAMLGSLKSITKVIVYVLVMIVELIVTFFAYQVICWVLVIVDRLATNFFPMLFAGTATGQSGASQINEMLNDSTLSTILFGDGNNPVAGAILQPVTAVVAKPVILISLLFGVIVLLAFIVMALRLRKTIVAACTEGLTSIVERLTETSMAGELGSRTGMGLGRSIATGMTMARQVGNRGAKAAASGVGTAAKIGGITALAGGGGLAAAGIATGENPLSGIAEGASGFANGLIGNAGSAENATGVMDGEDAVKDTAIADSAGGIEGSDRQGSDVYSQSNVAMDSDASNETYADASSRNELAVDSASEDAMYSENMQQVGLSVNDDAVSPDGTNRPDAYAVGESYGEKAEGAAQELKNMSSEDYKAAVAGSANNGMKQLSERFDELNNSELVEGRFDTQSEKLSEISTNLNDAQAQDAAMQRGLAAEQGQVYDIDANGNTYVREMTSQELSQYESLTDAQKDAFAEGRYDLATGQEIQASAASVAQPTVMDTQMSQMQTSSHSMSERTTMASMAGAGVAGMGIAGLASKSLGATRDAQKAVKPMASPVRDGSGSLSKAGLSTQSAKAKPVVGSKMPGGGIGVDRASRAAETMQRHQQQLSARPSADAMQRPTSGQSHLASKPRPNSSPMMMPASQSSVSQGMRTQSAGGSVEQLQRPSISADAQNVMGRGSFEASQQSIGGNAERGYATMQRPDVVTGTKNLEATPKPRFESDSAALV